MNCYLSWPDTLRLAFVQTMIVAAVWYGCIKPLGRWIWRAL
jgi:hypothetical protein